MKSIRIVINEDGSIETDYSGFVGESCERSINSLIERLREKGIKMTKKETRKKLGVYKELIVAQNGYG